ncbi:helix-turn-helix domain-containing protein [bacterium]|nr:helix-turn-helix domain-containing protein [bacterium]MBU1615905.1 helix-turn-helix domain-containing protein [bacterium]
MRTKTTTNAVEILKHRLSNDPELAVLVEEERKRLRLADKIRKVRLKVGLSQREIAKRIGSTQSAVARLESGNYERLSLSTLIKISLALNCRVNFEIEPAKSALWSEQIMASG